MLLPPEPNLDANAVATLQGTGGAACVAGAAYPNIVVGGVTIGTGLGPAPVKDASGFYHFKPSCYGYLNLGGLTGGGVSNVQVGPESPTAKKSVTAALPAPSQVGTLLVAEIRSDTDPTTKASVPPAGWASAAGALQAGAGHSEIFYYANNPGGISTATFTISPGSVFAQAQISEWRNVVAVSPLDGTGTFTASTNQATATISTSAAMTTANELVITSDGFNPQAGQVVTSGAGWNSVVNDVPNGFSAEYRVDLGTVVATETVTSNVATTWALAIATFKTASAAAAGAVFDPGFYYFNGSGFAGGGGVCLNGGTLLARDVTLEFVNQAGLASGSCVAGGGANCGGGCQFGSPPCSLQACPPNVAADSPNNLTWFAAPCSAAPSAADAASCPGSAWCPVGDRSCWNIAIWAAAANTGQIAIKGPAADAWLLGSIYWPGTCAYTDNGTSMIAGTISCGSLSLSAAGGAGTAVGGDAGISTALFEAVLVE
jgi:hypothetical protein